MASISLRTAHATLVELGSDFKQAGDNYGQLCRLIGVHGLDTGEAFPSNVTEARALIEKSIETRRQKLNRDTEFMEKRQDAMFKALKEWRTKQNECVDFFEGASREIESLNRLSKCLLTMKFQGLKQELVKRKTVMKDGNLRILLIGETCAGKSSFMNILMRGRYMPIDHGPCTRIACEVRNSKYRAAELHFESSQGRDPVLFSDLPPDPTAAIWSTIQDGIIYGRYPYEPSSEFGPVPGRLEKVVIDWPLDLLVDHTSYYKPIVTGSIMNSSDYESNSGEEEEESARINFTIIDVPGIADVEESSQISEKYIGLADSYICLVDNSRHHGVDSDRLGKLMEIIRKKSEERYGFFNPDCGMFFRTKLDLVADERKERLEEETFAKLSEFWPTVSRKQMYPFNGSDEVLDQVCAGLVPTEYVNFFHHACKFMETSAKVTLEANCWWLNSVLEMATAIAENAKYLVTKNKHTASSLGHLQRLKTLMLSLETKRREVEKGVVTLTESVNKELGAEIKKCLTENTTVLVEWSHRDIPVKPDGASWTGFHPRIRKQIMKRLEDLLWSDEKLRVAFENYKSAIRQKLTEITEAFQSAEQLMDLFDIPCSNPGIGPVFTNVSSPKIKTLLIAIGCVVALPLAPFALLIWTAYEELFLDETLDNEELFNTNPVDYMRKQTELLVKHVIRLELSQTVNARLLDLPSNAFTNLKIIGSCIEDKIKSIDEVSAAIACESQSRNSADAVVQLSEKLRQFYIAKIMSHDIDENFLRFDENDRSTIIGRGGHGVVVRGEFSGEEDTVDVAVKVLVWPLGDEKAPDNSFIFRECFIMRQLSRKGTNDNFVRFYGSLTQIDNERFKLYLVLELCHGDLLQLLTLERMTVSRTERSGHPFPGRPNADLTGLGIVYNWTLQTARGLKFLHDNNFVHRDIKSENYLVRIKGNAITIKLSDVGLGRHVDMVITRGPNFSTIDYRAPEVAIGGVHSKSSDVYSLAIVFWEIWHGKGVSDEFGRADNCFKLRELLLNSTSSIPVKEMKDLITSSCDKKAKARPTIEDIVERLQYLRDCFQFEHL